MKVCIIRPQYCTDYSKSDEYFAAELVHASGMCLNVVADGSESAKTYFNMGADAVITAEYETAK